MTFDEAWKRIKELSFPIQVPDEADDAEVWMSDLIDVFEELRQEYAPTVEMTKKQYEVWNVSLERSKKHKGDFIYFIDVLDDESSFQDNVFREKLEYFIDDSKLLMQAWLHPETIKIVDE